MNQPGVRPVSDPKTVLKATDRGRKRDDDRRRRKEGENKNKTKGENGVGERLENDRVESARAALAFQRIVADKAR